MLIDNLKAFVKSLNLVNLSGGPTKSADMLAYEAQVRNKGTVPKASVAPPVPAVLTSKPPPPPLVIVDPKAGGNVAPSAPAPSALAPSASLAPAVPKPLLSVAAAPKLAAFGSSLL